MEKSTACENIRYDKRNAVSQNRLLQMSRRIQNSGHGVSVTWRHICTICGAIWEYEVGQGSENCGWALQA
jgi:hypothetical protein